MRRRVRPVEDESPRGEGARQRHRARGRRQADDEGREGAEATETVSDAELPVWERDQGTGTEIQLWVSASVAFAVLSAVCYNGGLPEWGWPSAERASDDASEWAPESDFYFGTFFYDHIGSLALTTLVTAGMFWLFADDEDGQPSLRAQAVVAWFRRQRLYVSVYLQSRDELAHRAETIQQNAPLGSGGAGREAIVQGSHAAVREEITADDATAAQTMEAVGAQIGRENSMPVPLEQVISVVGSPANLEQQPRALSEENVLEQVGGPAAAKGDDEDARDVESRSGTVLQAGGKSEEAAEAMQRQEAAAGGREEEEEEEERKKKEEETATAVAAAKSAALAAASRREKIASEGWVKTVRAPKAPAEASSSEGSRSPWTDASNMRGNSAGKAGRSLRDDASWIRRDCPASGSRHGSEDGRIASPIQEEREREEREHKDMAGFAPNRLFSASTSPALERAVLSRTWSTEHEDEDENEEDTNGPASWGASVKRQLQDPPAAPPTSSSTAAAQHMPNNQASARKSWRAAHASRDQHGGGNDEPPPQPGFLPRWFANIQHHLSSASRPSAEWERISSASSAHSSRRNSHCSLSRGASLSPGRVSRRTSRSPESRRSSRERSPRSLCSGVSPLHMHRSSNIALDSRRVQTSLEVSRHTTPQGRARLSRTISPLPRASITSKWEGRSRLAIGERSQRAPRQCLRRSSPSSSVPGGANPTSFRTGTSPPVEQKEDGSKVSEAFAKSERIIKGLRQRVGVDTTPSPERSAAVDTYVFHSDALEDRRGRKSLPESGQDKGQESMRGRGRGRESRLCELAKPTNDKRLRHAEEERRIREEEEIAACTFKPTLIAKYRGGKMPVPSSARRKAHLQELMEREMKECTFQPRLVAKQPSPKSMEGQKAQKPAPSSDSPCNAEDACKTSHGKEGPKSELPKPAKNARKTPQRDENMKLTSTTMLQRTQQRRMSHSASPASSLIGDISSSPASVTPSPDVCLPAQGSSRNVVSVQGSPIQRPSFTTASEPRAAGDREPGTDGLAGWREGRGAPGSENTLTPPQDRQDPDDEGETTSWHQSPEIRFAGISEGEIIEQTLADLRHNNIQALAPPQDHQDSDNGGEAMPWHESPEIRFAGISEGEIIEQTLADLRLIRSLGLEGAAAAKRQQEAQAHALAEVAAEIVLESIEDSAGEVKAKLSPASRVFERQEWPSPLQAEARAVASAVAEEMNRGADGINTDQAWYKTRAQETAKRKKNISKRDSLDRLEASRRLSEGSFGKEMVARERRKREEEKAKAEQARRKLKEDARDAARLQAEEEEQQQLKEESEKDEAKRPEVASAATLQSEEQSLRQGEEEPEQDGAKGPDVTSFVGVGMKLVTDKRWPFPRIKQITTGGAVAACERVREGHDVLKVDGVDCSGKTVEEMSRLFLGPAGTPVVVTFRQPAKGGGLGLLGELVDGLAGVAPSVWSGGEAAVAYTVTLIRGGNS